MMDAGKISLILVVAIIIWLIFTMPSIRNDMS